MKRFVYAIILAAVLGAGFEACCCGGLPNVTPPTGSTPAPSTVTPPPIGTTPTPPVPPPMPPPVGTTPTPPPMPPPVGTTPTPPPMPPPMPPPGGGVVTNQALLDGQLATVQARFAPGTIPAGGPPVYGTLATGATQDFNFTLAATCYKIIGVGGAGVQDLDLVIYDQAGTRLAADVATDNTPVVGLEQPFCPATGGTFRVEVRMYAGAGEFAVQMYRNP